MTRKRLPPDNPVEWLNRKKEQSGSCKTTLQRNLLRRPLFPGTAGGRESDKGGIYLKESGIPLYS